MSQIPPVAPDGQSLEYQTPVGPVARPVMARDVVDREVRQSRDRAQYVRQQKGHSLILHLIFGGFILWANVLYISVSPNHYWHA